MGEAVELLAEILGELRARRSKVMGESGAADRGGWSQSGRLDPNIEQVAGTGGSSFGAAYQFRSAEVCTVQFSVVAPTPSPTTVVVAPNPKATIRWKCRGNQATRVISVGSGAMISGVADAVDITVIDDTRATFGASPIPPNLATYGIIVTMSPGVRPFNSAVPSLRHYPSLILVAPHSTVDVPVPLGIGISSVLVQWFSADPTVRTGALLGMLNSVGPLAGMSAAIESPTYQSLVPGTETVQLGNTNATKPMFFSIEWGIDG